MSKQELEEHAVHFLHRYQDWIVLLIFAALAALLVMNLIEIKNSPPVSTPPVATETARHSHCADFKTQKEAQAALLAGDWWLDGDGNHIACQSLP